MTGDPMREAFERTVVCVLTREFGTVSYEGAESDDEVLRIYEADEDGKEELKHFRELAGELSQAALSQTDVSKETQLNSTSCTSVCQPRMSEDEAVEIMCRAVTKHTVGGPDALVYASLDDFSTGIKTPLWQTHQYNMREAYRALLTAMNTPASPKVIRDALGVPVGEK